MKHVKVGHHVDVLVVDRYFHAQVTEVTTQDAIKVKIKDGAEQVATRINSPGWFANRFEV
jgi:hypothetical protein